MDLVPLTLVRGLIDSALQNTTAPPKLLKTMSAEIGKELDASRIALCFIDRIATSATDSVCMVIVNNEWLRFDTGLNKAFFPELVRAQSIGAKVYIVYRMTASGNVISNLQVCAPEH